MSILAAALTLMTAGTEVTDLAEARVRAARVADAPRIDGVLDEPAWASVEPAAGFRQREPHEGERATEGTEVRLRYDRDALYVGILARDREPGKVIGRILQRDRVMEAGSDGAFRFAGDDAVAIILDPFQDRRNA